MFLGIRVSGPGQWHNKGTSSTRAQAAGPPPIPRVPRARTNKQGSCSHNVGLPGGSSVGASLRALQQSPPALLVTHTHST
jgi:hypothetical protein